MMIPFGKVTALLLGISLLLAPAVCAAPSAPEYSGAYAGKIVWEGTVVMAGDVLILKGGQLIIRPGTEVRVVPAEGTQIDPEYLSSQTELLIRGQLDVQGTAESPVRFVMVERSGLEAISWAGITLDRAAGSSISHAFISRADIAIRCVASSPLLEGNQLTACRYGIVAQEQSHPKILGNLIADGEGGIFCWRGSKPYLKDNRIIGNAEEGIFVDATSRPWLDHNLISKNAIGLALYPTDLPYDPTVVQGNTEDLRQLGRQGQNGVQP